MVADNRVMLTVLLHHDQAKTLDEIMAHLERTGYRFGYTACPHQDERHPTLTIERLLLWEGSSVDGDGRFSPAILNCEVHDLWPPARSCGRVHHV